MMLREITRKLLFDVTENNKGQKKPFLTVCLSCIRVRYKRWMWESVQKLIFRSLLF